MLLQQVRDEAHRFAITFHRKKRSKAEIRTELEDLKGIGKQTADILLKHFKSVKKIKEAPENELVELVGTARAHRLLNYFREQRQNETPTSPGKDIQQQTHTLQSPESSQP